MRDAASAAIETRDPSMLADPIRDIADDVQTGDGVVSQTVRRSVPLTKVITNRTQK